jgi:hypothetical protein
VRDLVLLRERRFRRSFRLQAGEQTLGRIVTRSGRTYELSDGSAEWRLHRSGLFRRRWNIVTLPDEQPVGSVNPVRLSNDALIDVGGEQLRWRHDGIVGRRWVLDDGARELVRVEERASLARQPAVLELPSGDAAREDLTFVILLACTLALVAQRSRTRAAT